jgi:putative ATP-dependent endonuclease of OLD family
VRITKINVRNFRGIFYGEVLLPEHAVLVGDNNIGKSTLLEAIDLVLGPERLSRRPVIDEHDFYTGKYIDLEGNPVPILIEVVVTDLSENQERHFRDHLEWWNEQSQNLLEGPPPEETDLVYVKSALRIGFEGKYDTEEDDFVGSTFFSSPTKEDGTHDTFRISDKRLCGFLYLRTLRTGSRALSLERGSLLDIILRLHDDKNFKIWENVLEQLRDLPVAENPDLGITDILNSIQGTIRKFLPADSVSNPHMRVSDLTRETLRRTLTVFMATGVKREDGSDYAAPFQHQGTGTINTLVLALLSLIADLKQNVIFAMEEPEIAIPPHTQKRIIDGVRSRSAQALFTSHSPYVLEEFPPEQIVVLKRHEGQLSAVHATYPPTVKPKTYKEEIRKRFCEALLARRVLIAEGRTEYDAWPAAARRLHELYPDEFHTVEAMGIAIINATTDTQVAPLGNYFSMLGKTVFAVFDKQEAEQKTLIDSSVQYPFEAQEKGFENIVLNGTAGSALRRFAMQIVDEGEWPTHLNAQKPIPTTPLADLRVALKSLLSWAKGSGYAADLLSICSKDEMPEFIVETLLAIQRIIEPPEASEITIDDETEVTSEGEVVTA